MKRFKPFDVNNKSPRFVQIEDGLLSGALGPTMFYIGDTDTGKPVLGKDKTVFIAEQTRVYEIPETKTYWFNVYYDGATGIYFKGNDWYLTKEMSEASISVDAPTLGLLYCSTVSVTFDILFSSE